MQFFVYVIRNPEGRLYIGFTEDLENRIDKHKNGKSGWTRSRGTWVLVHYETFTNRTDALKRELYLKQGRANQELREGLLKAQAVELVLPRKD